MLTAETLGLTIPPADLRALFVTLGHCLPGRTDLMKGLSFGAMVWFLRVVMRAAGDWVTTTVPASAHAYSLVAGLVQMLLVAVLIALLLPQPHGTNTTHLGEGDADMALEAKAR